MVELSAHGVSDNEIPNDLQPLPNGEDDIENMLHHQLPGLGLLCWVLQPQENAVHHNHQQHRVVEQTRMHESNAEAT